MPEHKTIEENILAEIRASAEQGGRAAVTFIPEPSAESLFCPIISVDDHVLEPPELFATRVPVKMREHAPHVQYDDAGLPWWVIDGRPTPLLLVNGGSGRTMSEWGTYPARYTEFRPAVYDPKLRLHDMDL